VIAPAKDYQRSRYHQPAKPFQGADAALNSLIGCYERRRGVLHQLRRDAEAVDALAPDFIELSEGKLHQRLMELRQQFHRGGKSPDLIAALAAIREASSRKLGMRPFLVQIMGALALHRGYLAEMATGEGKTLTAGLAAVLAGWTKKPCHIVTVNDYLVERDADRLGPLYEFCGVRVGCVTAMMGDKDRINGYACDVTYATSKELLADFLRDRLRLGELHNPTRRLIRELLQPQAGQYQENGLVMRGLHTAIVDEADSVLIDEAVTPLIISAPHENQQLKEAGEIAHAMVNEMCAGEHYQVNLRYKEIELTEAGNRKLQEQAERLPGLWQGSERRLELVVQALVAREFYKRDKQYIIDGGKVVIVDEFTGRPMPQRTWREGMHQAIEAKEGVDISHPSETIARLSFQRFFRCFYRLSGMTGTAREAAAELWQTYRLPVIPIPTNRPCIRKQYPDRIFARESSKWDAIVEEIARMHGQGRPILVGTRSVWASEMLAQRLAQKGMECSLLNASRLKEEAAIIALAGEHARITIATNMAGRGTDILLGRGVPALGGLHVIATERHESGRVDRQLFGRSARQGDPGSAQAFVSLEDELVRRYIPAPVQKTIRAAFSATPKAGKMAFALAQRNAQRLAAKQRRGVLQSDLWLDKALSFAGGVGV
jgi:preprotein translocase subunit SecA